jgi:hypothetical protein
VLRKEELAKTQRYKAKDYDYEAREKYAMEKKKKEADEFR